ncbi:RNA helicase [Malassezia equina]|uniref:RNA helicase n=1 Tax=Malassezia equina TaxID=1381935 RepID=A0AAF0J0V7_9BASI|nr:RNA helicase [Malassezia equina]
MPMSLAQPLGYTGVPLKLFEPSKSQKRAVSDLYWSLRGQTKPSRYKGKWGKDGPWSLQQRLGLILQPVEAPSIGAPYDVPVSEKIEPASSTQEKYQLFRRYQASIHHESPSEISDRSGWESFLVEAPFPMRYKGEFRPCELLDTSDNRWHALEKVLPRLRAGQRAYFDTTLPPTALTFPIPPSLTETDDMSMDDDLPHPLPLGYATLESVRSKSDECGVLDIGHLPAVLRSLQKSKTQWLENPKNIIYTYTQSRFGTTPQFNCTEGRFQDRHEKVIRCTCTIDDEFGIVATGDGHSQKEAEKTAALHGMLMLLERDFISNPPPGLFGGAKGSSKALSATLPDGSDIVLETAREFIDYFCHQFHHGNPDISVAEMNSSQGRRLVSSGWKAVMSIGGTVVGEGLGTSKKVAQNMAYLDTAVRLEKEFHDVYEKFLLEPKNKPMGKASPVYFHVSASFEESLRHLYDQMRDSELYANRPRTTAAFSFPTDATTKESLSVKQSCRPTLSDEEHEAKSALMLQTLNRYQTDDRVQSIRTTREMLPVTQHAGDVLVKVELNPVTICMASTGSGKTTQVPQILLDDYILRNQGSHCNIICTQPRRIAAISVAQRVATERGEKVGDTVGYQVRFDSKLPKPHGSITFCTTGVFLRRLQSAMESPSGFSFLDDITHVLMDEVHERDVETDLLLVIIKRVLADRQQRGLPEIKLILMSATVDPKMFQDYFAELLPSGCPAPVVTIPGRSYPVKKVFLEDTYERLNALTLSREKGGWIWHEKNVRDYIHREITQKGGQIKGNMGGQDGVLEDDLELPYPLIALMIADVLSRSEEGHVLVFLPGWDEIKIVHQILLDTKQCPLLGLPLDDPEKYEVHILHSSVPVEDQQAVFETPRHDGIRRIILSTNIAETSVTIPDVVYVIDSGRVKEKRYDPERHLSSLVSAWVGTSNLNQRAGRAGRHRPGEYYGVLSKARYDQLNVHQTVEMKRVDLSNVVMHIKALGISGMEVEDVLAAAIEPPASERVKAAMHDLKRIGALDYHMNLTSLGKVLQHLPLDVSIGKMCLYGAFYRCLDPVLALAAILTNRDPFIAPMHLKKEANAIKDSWCPTTFRSDPFCVLNAFYEWTRLQSISSSQANRFLHSNMLSRPTMLQIQQIKQNLFQSLQKADIIKVIRQSTSLVPRYRRRVRETDPEFNLNAHSMPLLGALVAVASSPNFAIRQGERTFRTSQDKTCFIHPSSVCSSKFTKDVKGSLPPQKDIYAFAEKIRNTSMQTAGSSGGSMTFLRTCTRLDPLSYMLFGATEAQATAQGLECDAWLPVTGNYDALDSIERIKSVMDACMLRVFEGVRSRVLSHTGSTASGAAHDSQLLSEDPPSDDDDEDADPATPTALPLSQREMEEFEQLTKGIVHLLDQYTEEHAYAYA